MEFLVRPLTIYIARSTKVAFVWVVTLTWPYICVYELVKVENRRETRSSYIPGIFVLSREEIEALHEHDGWKGRSVAGDDTSPIGAQTCLKAPLQPPIILKTVPANLSALLCSNRLQSTDIDALISNKNRMRFGLQEVQNSSAAYVGLM